MHIVNAPWPAIRNRWVRIYLGIPGLLSEIGRQTKQTNYIQYKLSRQTTSNTPWHVWSVVRNR